MTTKINFASTSSAGILVIGLASLLAFSAAGDSPLAVNVKNLDKLTWTKATVNGEVKQLKAFDANLRKILGFTNLESHFMGCVLGCDQLDSESPPGAIEYIFARDNPELIKRFIKAWDTTPGGTMDPGFKITFVTDRVSMDCPTTPVGCQQISFCAIDRCGQKKTKTVDCAAC